MPTKKQIQENLPPNAKEDNRKVENMLQEIRQKSSKHELLQAIQQMNKPDSRKKTLKTPSQILEYISERDETIESLAQKAEISEREILLAIRDDSDTANRKKIAEVLNTTYFSLFGK